MLTLGTDTYCTLDAATDYFEFFGDGVETDEPSLRKATLAIDRLYGLRFKGTVTELEQPLLFPRNGSTSIPKCVQEACAELAAMITAQVDVYAEPEGTVTKSSVDVQGIKTSVEYAKAYRSNPMYKIELILAPVLKPNTEGTLQFVNVVHG